MLVVGLTGGIGCGKTTVARIFSCLGIPVFNADKVAKMLMEQDERIVQAVTKTFGDQAYLNGVLNRAYISNIVFSNSYQLDLLNSIVHPVVIQAGAAWAAQQNSPYVIKEAALMFESGSVASTNFVIGVDAPLALRTLRVMRRDALSKQAVEARMQQQITASLKMKLCDAVIHNNEVSLLLPQVLQLHQQLLLLGKQQLG